MFLLFYCFFNFGISENLVINGSNILFLLLLLFSFFNIDFSRIYFNNQILIKRKTKILITFAQITLSDYFIFFVAFFANCLLFRNFAESMLFVLFFISLCLYAYNLNVIKSLLNSFFYVLNAFLILLFRVFFKDNFLNFFCSIHFIIAFFLMNIFIFIVFIRKRLLANPYGSYQKSNFRLFFRLNKFFKYVFLNIAFLFRVKKRYIIQNIFLYLAALSFLLCMRIFLPDRFYSGASYFVSLFYTFISGLFSVMSGSFLFSWGIFYNLDFQLKLFSQKKLIYARLFILVSASFSGFIVACPFFIMLDMFVFRFISIFLLCVSILPLFVLFLGIRNYNKVDASQNPWLGFEGENKEQYIVMWASALFPVIVYEGLRIVFEESAALKVCAALSIIVFMCYPIFADKMIGLIEKEQRKWNMMK